MALIYFDGRIGEGRLPDGTPIWQFEAIEEYGRRIPVLEMYYVTNPEVVAFLRGVETDTDNPRLIDMDCEKEPLPEGLKKGRTVTAAERPRWSICHTVGFGGYYAVIHPRGDTTRVSVAPIVPHEEEDWLFVSDGRFDDERDADDEMNSIARTHGLVIETD